MFTWTAQDKITKCFEDILIFTALRLGQIFIDNCELKYLTYHYDPHDHSTAQTVPICVNT